MQTILPPSGNTVKILGKARSAEQGLRWMHYVLAQPVDGGEKVGIQWFGGEPLFNKAVIDIICNDLTAKGVEYHSTMISNGYLFDDATVKQAVELWKLKRIQITLDGPSSYQVVLANIERLLDAGVSVGIRLNMDNHNAENLMLLADELHERFAGRKHYPKNS